MIKFVGRKNAEPVDSPEKVVSASSVQAIPGDGLRDSQGHPAPQGYMDFGSLYVPLRTGILVRGEFAPDKKSLRSVTLTIDASSVTVSVVAAPKSENLWPELADQMAASIEQAGGSVSDSQGPYGKELIAKMAVALPDGSQGLVPRRFIGVDGPRWMARIVIDGAAAAGDEAQLTECMAIIGQLVVHRGSEPRVRLEYLPLQMPKGAVQVNGTA